jgi:hypothetical protein
MTWSYITSELATNQTYQVRLLIGDTIKDAPQMQDEEIAFLIVQNGSIYAAAAACCRALSTQYARSADVAAGDQSIKFSQMSKSYLDKALAFQSQAALMGAGQPYVGGISIADKIQNEQDADRVAPNFKWDIFDNNLPLGQLQPGTVDSDEGSNP